MDYTAKSTSSKNVGDIKGEIRLGKKWHILSLTENETDP